jgi:glycine/D-amino acid oxidase-like deaminating enzyme
MVRRAHLDSTLVEGAPFPTDDERCADVMAGAAEVMPSLKHAHVEAVRVGIRPIPRDGLSAVGPDPRVPGLYHVVTHSGVTLAALLGRLVCSDLLGGNPPELAPFRPARFSDGRAISVAQTSTEE